MIRLLLVLQDLQRLAALGKLTDDVAPRDDAAQHAAAVRDRNKVLSGDQLDQILNARVDRDRTGMRRVTSESSMFPACSGVCPSSRRRKSPSVIVPT